VIEDTHAVANGADSRGEPLGNSQQLGQVGLQKLEKRTTHVEACSGAARKDSHASNSDAKFG